MGFWNRNKGLNFKKIEESFLSLFLPADCKICSKPLKSLNCSFICEECWNKVKWLEPPYCSICSKPFSPSETSPINSFSICAECKKNSLYFKKVFVPTLYEGVMKKIIHIFKYQGKRGVIRGIKKIMETYFSQNHLPFSHLHLVVPIPLYRNKLKERGFNQAELLARIIAEYFNIKLSKSNLEKIKPTQSQTKLSASKRIKNMKGVFVVKNKEEFWGKDILLVDDIYTTGATLKEAAKILKKARAKEIYAFTLARAKL